MISDWFSSLTKHDLAHIDNNWTMKNSHYKRSFRNRPHQPMIRKVDFRFLPFSIYFFLFVKLPYIAKRWYKNLEIDLTKPIIVLCWWWCCACSVNVIFFVKMSSIISANKNATLKKCTVAIAKTYHFLVTPNYIPNLLLLGKKTFKFFTL